MSQWNTDLTHEQLERFVAIEDRLDAVESRVSALEQAGGADVESATWETPQEGDEGAEGEGTTVRRRGKRQTEGDE